MRAVGARAAASGPARRRCSFDSEACHTATLVEIVTEDRPGLLYSAWQWCSRSNNCNIDVVLIDTQRRSAIDVFYVAYEGRKLTPRSASETQGEAGGGVLKEQAGGCLTGRLLPVAGRTGWRYAVAGRRLPAIVRRAVLEELGVLAVAEPVAYMALAWPKIFPARSVSS